MVVLGGGGDYERGTPVQVHQIAGGGMSGILSHGVEKDAPFRRTAKMAVRILDLVRFGQECRKWW